MELAVKKIKHKYEFSKEGAAELADFHKRIIDNLRLAFSVFINDNGSPNRGVLCRNGSTHRGAVCGHDPPDSDVGALCVGDAPTLMSGRAEITAMVARLRLPAIYGFREFADAGGLMSYGYGLPDAYRQSPSGMPCTSQHVLGRPGQVFGIISIGD
jgi:hypothetical protein